MAGDTGAALLSRMVALAEAHQVRQRALQPDAVKSRVLTASTLLANLASLALNRVDDTRFLAVSFNRNAYANTPLSLSAMSLLRDAMLANGLIEGSAGGQRVRADDSYFGWLTRMRATPALRTIFADCGIGYASIRRTVGNVLILRDRKAGVSSEPPIDVEMTRQTLASMNKRIEAARIELPQDAWAGVTPGVIDAMHLDDEDRAPAGDLVGKSLVRLFKYDWRQGGRLYGGWWMSLPKRERKLLTIDGEAVAELDYGQLHPSILYARTHEELDGDAYTVGDWTSPAMRELGKTTFARMLNTTTSDGEPRAIQMAEGDADKLPPGVTWEDYLHAFQRKLAPISEWFWIGEGLRLQREDSDVAVSVLEAMNKHGIVTLPVHDSFIVQDNYRHLLRTAMIGAYREKFYYHPIIKEASLRVDNLLKMHREKGRGTRRGHN
ncbi:MAG: hypothetical protein INE95_04845 [Phenylobacterium sp.]|nr:hypothetical protein [Phenylobacterium sp.]